MISRGVIVAAVAALLGLASFVGWQIHQNPRLPDGQAERVLQQAVDLIRRDALWADGTDWDQEKQKALKLAARTGRLLDLDEALQGLVQTLRERDGHSFYLPPRVAAGLTSTRAERSETSLAVLSGEQRGVAVLRINAWAALDGGSNARAAANAAALLASELQRQPCGVILDIRDNGGGNMYPMLQAVGVLLPPGDLGYFETRDRQRIAWPVPARSGPARQVAIAVLIGPGTASSGEFLAVGLRKAPRVRFFGAPTAGFSTANQVHPLAHGGLLAVTVARMLDAQGRPVSGRLAPDEEYVEPLAPAADWVLAQCPARATERG